MNGQIGFTGKSIFAICTTINGRRSGDSAQVVVLALSTKERRALDFREVARIALQHV